MLAIEKDAIEQISRTLKIKLKCHKELSITKQCYTVNKKQQVVGLSLAKCGITSLNCVQKSLMALGNLTELSLFNNQLSNIDSLVELTTLTSLMLRNNQIKQLPSLTKLINLRRLYLGQNQLDDSCIARLSLLGQLMSLDLENCNINDVSFVQSLPNLVSLYLVNNRISDISSLATLNNIITLDLSGNKISDISPLKSLTQLICLQVRNNAITSLPHWILDWDLPIYYESLKIDSNTFIDLSDNPITSPPLDIVKQGNQAMANFFAQMKNQPEGHLFEAKMLVIGEPGAGKTSLVRKVENPDALLPNEDDTTKGIDVKRYCFPLKAEDFPSFPHPDKLEGKDFRVNLWDFGGQEIYKATHRFFLSKRSLYALVSDSRNEDTDFNYWLHIVEMFGGDSPLFIILNEKHQREGQLDVAAMKERFTNITEVLTVNLAGDDHSRLHKIRSAIKYHISHLPHIGSPVPATWTAVRKAVEDELRNTISVQDYLNICRSCNIHKLDDAMNLSQYFHDIGVFLHFQDDPVLTKTLFLKPNWATNAVYKVLDSALLTEQQGRFSKNDAKHIWSDEQYNLLRDDLLRLMHKFFLSFETKVPGQYIVPEKLPAAKAEYRWQETSNLFLRYRYEVFMPKGLLSHLMVELNHLIKNQNKVWRRGMILQKDGAIAEVIETYDARAINIRLSGENHRSLLIIIMDRLDQINAQYEKMPVEKLIPCNCLICNKADEPHFYKYSDLERRVKKGKKTIECNKSYEDVTVLALLNAVMDAEVVNPIDRFALRDCPPDASEKNEKPVRDKVFVSYSHKDKDVLEIVKTHLKVLKNEGIKINLWDDTQLKAGDLWFNEINQGLDSAKVAILLVSTEFLASDFISNDELPALLKAAEQDGASILSLILKPCRFGKKKQLSKYQSINAPDNALSKQQPYEQDETLLALVERVADLMGAGE